MVSRNGLFWYRMKLILEQEEKLAISVLPDENDFLNDILIAREFSSFQYVYFQCICMWSTCATACIWSVEG